MPIPEYQGVRTYFFLADVEPKESMRLGVEAGISLDDDATLEVLGHMLAWWSPAKHELDFQVLQARVQDMFDVTLALEALGRIVAGEERHRLARRAVMHSWLELREVDARANVIGTIHSRYRFGDVVMDGEAAAAFARAARAAWNMIDQGPLRLAFKDYGASLLQLGDDAFLFAYRAVENARRSVVSDTTASEGTSKAQWEAMHTALGTSASVLTPLTDAATAIRHGHADDPQLIAVRTAEARESTLQIADEVLTRLVEYRQLLK